MRRADVLPLVITPNVELWAYEYLTAALAARDEPYAAATVDIRLPATLPERLVWVRRDGGPREDILHTSARLAVNVLTSKESDADALAALVEGLLLSVRASSPVEAVTSLSGPSVVSDPSVRPRRFFTVEVLLRGVVT